MDKQKGTSTLNTVSHWCNRLICRLSSHDLWVLAYPPARRSECHRCGLIVEDVPTHLLKPERRRVPRDRANEAGGPTRA